MRAIARWRSRGRSRQSFESAGERKGREGGGGEDGKLNVGRSGLNS